METRDGRAARKTQTVQKANQPTKQIKLDTLEICGHTPFLSLKSENRHEASFIPTLAHCKVAIIR